MPRAISSIAHLEYPCLSTGPPCWAALGLGNGFSNDLTMSHTSAHSTCAAVAQLGSLRARILVASGSQGVVSQFKAMGQRSPCNRTQLNLV